MDRVADVSSSRGWTGLTFIALAGLVHLIESPKQYPAPLRARGAGGDRALPPS